MNYTYWLGHTLFREFVHGFFDFRVVGRENLKFEGPALVACNHVSFFDPPCVGQGFDQSLHYFARKSLFTHPMAGWILRRWHTIPIDREKPDTSSLKTTMRLIKAGKKVLIFPEGTRSPDNRLQKAEAGVGFFIAKTGAPVLPVRLFGTYEAFPRGARFPRPTQITLVVGQLYQPDIQMQGHTGRALYQTLADEVMERIGGLTL